MANLLLHGGGPLWIDRAHDRAARDALIAAARWPQWKGDWSAIAGAPTAAAALATIHWKSIASVDGDIVGVRLALDLEETWQPTFDRAFEALAPHAVDGSWVEVFNEGGGHPHTDRWEVAGGKLIRHVDAPLSPAGVLALAHLSLCQVEVSLQTQDHPAAAAMRERIKAERRALAR